DPESLAFFSVGEDEHVEGLVIARGTKFALYANRRPIRSGGRVARTEVDHFVTEFEAEDEMPDTNVPSWACDYDRANIRAPKKEVVARSPQTDAVSVAQGITGTQSYEITVEIETDFDLYQNSGSNSTNLTNYITNLTGAVSTIYNRDLHTNVV